MRHTGPIHNNRSAGTNICHQMLMLMVFAMLMLAVSTSAAGNEVPSLDEIEARLQAFEPRPGFPDDAFALITLREGLASLRANSGGGIGAILVDEKSGQVIERGRNRQYQPYFRSDMHAEMDLLTRYEDRLQKKGGWKSGVNPRQTGSLVLYSSMEPCPMCLIRIINAGIMKMYYVGDDPTGGMVHQMQNLPEFWRDMARGRDYGPAQCSPELKQIASDLFDHSRHKPSRKE